MLETRSRRTAVGLQIAATLLIIPFLFPLVVTVQGSFGGRGWGNYEAVLAIPNLWRYFLDSTVIALSVIAIVFICTLLAAFAFSKLRVPAKEFFF
ncbi:ABC transporter permease family protein [Microbacterium saperdae]|uniref:hypothetical protein n=1 Tax=Microbacterium saperdae TaxID=69368 RepID=UPI0019AC1FE0|nr:hypothetical protein [Microbacterium saperdae]GGM62899.1 hypothetical protein GCM10010489_37970 [Microbacterium saperdae]